KLPFPTVVQLLSVGKYLERVGGFGKS
ncbi:ATP synthase alpha/beta family, nucleotide-binding domain protein, partial [Chlamydia psittaci 06-1683]